MKKLLCSIGVGLLTACSAPSSETEFPPFGVWELVEAESNVSFVSLKKETVAETHDFTGVTSLVGSVHADGSAVLTIVLDGIESHIDVRNVRMREHLFETRTHPFVTLSTKIDVETYQTLEVGSVIDKTIDVNIDVHDKYITKRIDVTIQRTSADGLSVLSRMPVHINASDFGMSAGVLKLQDLAKLSSISPEVDVSFVLQFER